MSQNRLPNIDPIEKSIIEYFFIHLGAESSTIKEISDKIHIDGITLNKKIIELKDRKLIIPINNNIKEYIITESGLKAILYRTLDRLSDNEEKIIELFSSKKNSLTILFQNLKYVPNDFGNFYRIHKEIILSIVSNVNGNSQEEEKIKNEISKHFKWFENSKDILQISKNQFVFYRYSIFLNTGTSISIGFPKIILDIMQDSQNQVSLFINLLSKKIFLNIPFNEFYKSFKKELLFKDPNQIGQIKVNICLKTQNNQSPLLEFELKIPSEFTLDNKDSNFTWNCISYINRKSEIPIFQEFFKSEYSSIAALQILTCAQYIIQKAFSKNNSDNIDGEDLENNEISFLDNEQINLQDDIKPNQDEKAIENESKYRNKLLLEIKTLQKLEFIEYIDIINTFGKKKPNKTPILINGQQKQHIIYYSTTASGIHSERIMELSKTMNDSFLIIIIHYVRKKVLILPFWLFKEEILKAKQGFGVASYNQKKYLVQLHESYAYWGGVRLQCKNFIAYYKFSENDVM